MKKKNTVILAALLAFVAAACVLITVFSGTKIWKANGEDASGSTAAAASGSAASTGTGGGSITLSDKEIKVSGSGMQTEGKRVTISAGGKYTVEGTASEGQIYVQAGDEDEVTLEFNGVSLSNTKDHPIHVENAKELILISGGDKENVITAGDGTEAARSDAGKETQVAAIYSRDDIKVKSGVYKVTASGDGLHSNDDIKINGGTVTITCGDDGIHANEELKVRDGVIEITKSNEGLEANQIEISGGEQNILASDDGVNANGGQNSSGGGFGREPGGGMNREASATEAPQAGSESEEDGTNEELTPNLTITGGTMYVNAQGDGLDSNGNITVVGGTVVVDGPSSDGNGAIDSGSESGGVCKITGGTILAVGSSGMAEGFDDGESTQYSFLHNLDARFEEGEEISVLDENGKELISHKAVREGASVVFSSPDLKKGKTYTLKTGEEKTEVTLESMAVSNGGNFGGGPGGGHGGGGFRGGGNPGDGDRPEPESFGDKKAGDGAAA